MKILITGGAGFIGSSLIRTLLNADNTVYAIDNFNPYYNPTYKRENIEEFLPNKNFCLYEGDITNVDLLDSIFGNREIDKVVHLAASVGVRNSLEHPDIYIKNNIEGTQKILDMVGKYGVKHFLFASSSSIYGNNSSSPFEEDKVTDSPLSPYAQTKKDGELLCLAHHKVFNTFVTILRFFTVYGPKGRPDMSPYIFTESILKNKQISIFGDGNQLRDFTYIDDLISGIILAIENEFPLEIFNLGGSSPITINDFIKKIEKISGEKAILEYRDRFLPEMKNTYANIQKAEKLLNYKPCNSIDEGLEKFIEWFKQNRLI